ncbi:MAG: FKBP-type 16 kDa peptidyl-prolyl cis-trans isomerase [bacterium ADurb.Bin236]|nr:MAG: FKBP-type 16 kDa peptidyl-prolyl cis-trans isomerase [bacterium ADurb.Bin236]
MQEIEYGSTVKMHYAVRLDDGTEVDSSAGREPLEFTVGESPIIAGMINNVIGMRPGDKKSFAVKPSEAYGESDPEQMKSIPRSAFPDGTDVCVGARFMACDENGNNIPLNIISVDEETVVADFNHPLAGKQLTFDVEIVDVKVCK